MTFDPPSGVSRDAMISAIRDVAISQANARHIPFDGSWILDWWTNQSEDHATGEIQFTIHAKWRAANEASAGTDGSAR